LNLGEQATSSNIAIPPDLEEQVGEMIMLAAGRGGGVHPHASSGNNVDPQRLKAGPFPFFVWW